MSRDEFDAWIEKHYTELLRVARRRVKRDAEDVLQRAVAGMLASPELGRRSVSAAWPWAVGFVRGEASHERRGTSSRRALLDEAKKVSSAWSLHGWKRPAPGAE